MKILAIKILCLFFSIATILCGCSKDSNEKENELTTSDFVFQCLEKKTITSKDFDSGSNSDTKYEVNVIGYCKKNIKEYRITIRYLDEKGRIITEDFIEAKKEQNIEAEKELTFSKTFESEYIVSSIKDVKITFWGIEYTEETHKDSSNIATTIISYIAAALIIIGFVAFFVWLIKEGNKSEEEIEKTEEEPKSKKGENTNTESNEEPEEPIETQTIDYSTFIFCTQCHSKNKPQNQYCFNCGNSLKFPLQVEEESHCKTENELKIRIMQLEAQLKLAQNSSMNSEAVEQLRTENRELHQKIDEYTANNDYRKRYPAPYLCESGHWVRSKSEREIDNFLFKHRIRYIFEKEYVYNPKSYPYYPDFYLPDYDLFIEYFGMYEDPKYNEKTKRKLDIYSQDTTKNFEFITFEDDNRLQERLAEICRKYNIPLA